MLPDDAAELIREHGKPPWDELRSARVQKRLAEERALAAPAPKATPRRWPWLVAAAAAAALVLVVLLAGLGPEDENRVHFADGSSIKVEESARVVSRIVTEEHIEVEQLSGTATYHVSPRPTRRFVVLIGGARVQVLGTRFNIEKMQQGVRIRVLEGRVQVTRGPQHLVLKSGEEVTLRDEAMAQGTAANSSASPNSPAPSGTTPIVSAENAGELVEDDAGLVDDSEAKPSGSSVKADTTGPSAAELFRQADGARAAGNRAQALSLLQQLLREHPRDGRVTMARFTIGRLHAQSGNLAAAAAAYEGCGASLGGEALAEAALARSKLGQSGRARALAQRYMQTFPKGPRAKQLARLAE